MSVLDFPRIHFKGDCQINASTGNNNDVTTNIDAVNATLRPFLQGLDDEQARAWMMGGFQAEQDITGDLRWYLRAGWNYFGNLSFKFKDVSVTAVILGDGAEKPDDPMIGLPVALSGSGGHGKEGYGPPPVICDLDPTVSVLSQLFLGGFSAGSDGLRAEATCDLRAFGRWLVWRNATHYQGEQNFPGAGATWQFAIPAGSLSFVGQKASPALDALWEEAQRAVGIVVQFATFLPEPLIGDEELISRFRREDYVQNPVAARVVGTIGVWKQHELKTMPAGRLLLPALPTTIGPATAQVQRHREVVSLNLVTTFPEADYFRPPAKYDYGPVRLGVIPSLGTGPIAISEPIPYDYETYETHGGIVDVPYDPNVVTRDELDHGELVLLFDPSPDNPIPLMSESDSIVTVETDDRGIYLDVYQTGRVEILVRERGEPPSKDVTVYLWEYQSEPIPEEYQKRAGAALKLVEPGSGRKHRLSFPASVVFPAGRADPLPIPFLTQDPGAVALAFTLDGKPLADGNPWGTASFAGVRVMPEDDYSTEDEETRLSWDFVYRTIFKYYHVVYPAMSKVIPFNDRDIMEQHAAELVARSDPALWGSTRYMPPTRDLSSGKRELLEEWADQF